jgi:MFS family permease
VLRKLLSVVLGYLLMASTVAIARIASAIFLGLDVVLEPGLHAPSATWIALSFAVGIPAAIAGGYVCRRIGRSRMLLHAFAVAVLLLGLLTAGAGMLGEPTPREAGETMSEALRQSRQPLWVALLNPLVGAGGILLGGSLRRDPPPERPVAERTD